jgi:phosphatidylinositol alpha-mannosyltransferase
MRIVQVSAYSWDAHGGVQAHVRQLAQQLRARGHETLVLAPGKPPFRRDGVRIVGRAIALRGNGSIARICFSPRSARRVERALQRFRPDVIHVHEPFSPSTALFAVLRANAPVVATFHSNVTRRRMYSVLYRAAVPFMRRVWNRIDRRLAVSEAARDSVVSRLGEAPVEIVPNGTDVARFGTAERAAVPAGRHLLFVGRLEPRKGFPVALDAFQRLAGRFPDLRLLVVGDGEDRAMVDALPPAVRDRVELRGRVGDDALPSCYRAADVFVAPALRGESFGIVLVEAMAAGRPIVASDISGYRDVVRHGREGLLVPPGDSAALADAVAALLDDPARARSFGAAGARRAARYDWRVIVDRLETIYRDLAAVTPPPRSAAAVAPTSSPTSTPGAPTPRPRVPSPPPAADPGGGS